MFQMIQCICVLAVVLAGVGCNQAELERLDTENQALQEQKSKLEGKVAGLEADIALFAPAQERLRFLAGKMRVLKARIVTNLGDIELSFFPKKAPIHCFNFLVRAESGFYDNTRFHRIIKDFMIQGGDPNSKDNDPYNDGAGGPKIMIPHEFNDTVHEPGIVSMARGDNASAGAGCQFFIMHGAAPHLDGQYTAFARVVKGMDVVNKIASLEAVTDDPRRREQPVQPVIVETVRVFW